MDWEKVLRKHFAKRGFRIEWVWMGPDAPYLLAWKGRAIQVHYVDLGGRIKGVRAPAIRESFLRLLQQLRQLAHADHIFKGREMRFHWLLLEDPTPGDLEKLREAGVEPFRFPQDPG